ncbi:hypothetical protein ACJHX4_14400, partial [Escherichia sp. WS2035]
MLPGCCKNGIVISKIPVMQAGLKEVMRTHFPEYEIISSASAEDLTLLQLRRSGLVIADLASESEEPRSVCEHYYSLNLQSKCNKKRSTHQLEYNFVSTQKPFPNDEYFLPTS